MFSVVGGMQVEAMYDSVVLKIHVSSEVQLPKLIAAPALSRYSWHGFLLLLGELEVTFCARLFLIYTTSLVPKSFLQLK